MTELYRSQKRMHLQFERLFLAVFLCIIWETILFAEPAVLPVSFNVMLDRFLLFKANAMFLSLQDLCDWVKKF